MNRRAQLETPGVVALRGLVGRGEGKVTQTDLALALGTSQQNVSKWLRGLARPQGLRALRIEHLYGIPQGDWLTDAERESLTMPPNRRLGGPRAA